MASGKLFIYESVWASMNGEPVQTMRDLARDVCVYVDDNARIVLNIYK